MQVEGLGPERKAEEEEEPLMLMLGLWCVHGGPLEM